MSNPRPSSAPTHRDDAKPGADPLVGKVIEGRYLVLEPLGQGGVGVVYRAEHVKLGRAVALKVLHPEYGAQDSLRRRFEREARALAALSHPNIVAITDYGISDNMPYLVMELLHGESLADRLHRTGVSPAQALDIARQMLRALAYAHGAGLLHRDLKPGNVFLQKVPGSPDQVKLLDFGLAKFVTGDAARDGAALTRAGSIFGTPAYMAPEQATGGETDVRTDVYSAGVVLFEMLAGRRPFEAEGADLLRQHLLTPVPPIASVRSDLVVTPQLDTLIQRAMAKERQNRFRDAAELLTALDELPKPPVRGAHGPPTPARSTPPPPFRGTLPSATIAAGPPVAAPPRAATPVATALPTAVGHGGAKRSSAAPIVVIALAAIVLVGVVGVVGVVAIALSGRDDDPQPTIAQPPITPPNGTPIAPRPATPGTKVAPQPTGGATQPERPPTNVAPTGRPIPRDPWRDDVPEALARVHRRIGEGRVMSGSEERMLLAWSNQHEDDPRPLLLLGHGYLSRRWRPDGIEKYEEAYARDPSARGDPWMIRNLVELVPHGNVGWRAARAIEQFYGPEALPVIDAALSAPGLDSGGVRALQRLRERIAR